MEMMKLMLKAQNVPDDLINQYMPAGGAGRRPQARRTPPVSPGNKGAQLSQAKTEATQIHEEEQDMAENNDNSGDCSVTACQNKNFLMTRKVPLRALSMTLKSLSCGMHRTLWG